MTEASDFRLFASVKGGQEALGEFVWVATRGDVIAVLVKPWNAWSDVGQLVPSAYSLEDLENKESFVEVKL